MASVIVEGVPPRARAPRSPFYVGASLYVVATVLAGFAPSFYLIAVDGRPRPWIMHLHAAVYLGWLALLVCQATLAARGKLAMHRRVGTLGIFYATGRPEVHKRLVLLACVAIMFAGASRLSYVLNLPGQLIVWFVPIVAGMVYDFYKRGSVHPVYWIGAAVMGVALLRIPFGATDFWHSVGRPLLTPFI